MLGRDCSALGLTPNPEVLHEQVMMVARGDSVPDTGNGFLSPQHHDFFTPISTPAQQPEEITLYCLWEHH